MQTLLPAAELIVLYILASGLTQAIYDLTILIFRSRTVGITVVSLLTFPGTVIHELAHLFTAEILGVRTGKLTLVPEGLDTEDTSASLSASVKAGSVMIAQSDPFRRYAIGLAPIFWGMIAVAALSYVLIQIVPTWEGWVNWGYLGIGYLLLAISNSMFSSKEDLKGFIPFIIALAAMIAAAYFAGLRIGLTGTLLDFITKILDALTKSLGIVLAINLGGLILTKGLILLVQKLTHRKLLRR